MSTKNIIKDLKLELLETTNEEEYSIPLDITDILFICQEYSRLGLNIQNQLEQILDCGVNSSIEKGIIKEESIPHIKDFLTKITQNAYFGDAISQAREYLYLLGTQQVANKNLN